MIQNLPFAPFDECSLSITTAVPDKEGVYNVAVFLADCTRGKESQIFIVFILIYLFEKNISQFFLVQNRTFILCKHFCHYSETCHHISLITGFKRKNAYIFGLKSVKMYMAVMGEINLPLIFL